MVTDKVKVINCLLCDSVLTKGRSDKKFCDEYCRIKYANNLKRDRNNTIRNINNTLSKNRYILENLIPFGCQIAKTTKEVLLSKGFQFKFFTHTHINKKGNTYHYCYEYGYLELENNKYLLVMEKKNNTI